MKFVHPSTFLVVGPTGSGKTYYISQLINNLHFDPSPDIIYYVYNEWQPDYELLQKNAKNIYFIKGGAFEILENLYNSLDPMFKNLLIIDDQMDSVGQSEILSKIFTQGSHHRNLSVIYLVQNMFAKGAAHRTASLNSQYIIIFKNPRDKGQIRILAKQLFPEKSKFLVDVFEQATKKPHSFLMLDLRQDTPEEIRVQSKVHPNKTAIVWQPL